jgi:hypothetical protein
MMLYICIRCISGALIDSVYFDQSFTSHIVVRCLYPIREVQVHIVQAGLGAEPFRSMTKELVVIEPSRRCGAEGLIYGSPTTGSFIY